MKNEIIVITSLTKNTPRYIMFKKDLTEEKLKMLNLEHEIILGVFSFKQFIKLPEVAGLK